MQKIIHSYKNKSSRVILLKFISPILPYFFFKIYFSISTFQHKDGILLCILLVEALSKIMCACTGPPRGGATGTFSNRTVSRRYSIKAVTTYILPWAPQALSVALCMHEIVLYKVFWYFLLAV